jgi:hypothetical protein
MIALLFLFIIPKQSATPCPAQPTVVEQYKNHAHIPSQEESGSNGCSGGDCAFLVVQQIQTVSVAAEQWLT